MRLVALTALISIGCVRENPNRFEFVNLPGFDLAKADDPHADLAGADLGTTLAKPDLSTADDLASADLAAARDFASSADFANPRDFATTSQDFATVPDLLMGDLKKTLPLANCPAGRAVLPFASISLTGSGSDADGGPVTYHWTVLNAPAGSTSQPSSPNSATTSFYLDQAGAYLLDFSVTDDEGATSSCSVSVKAAVLEVQLAWSTAWGDVDLQVTRQSNSWFTETGNACWWKDTSVSWPPAGTEGDGALDQEDYDGFGPERVRVNNPAAATYEIGVNYWCSNSTNGDGATTGTVKVYCNGTLAATYGDIALDKTGRFVHVANLTMPGCIGQSIMNSTSTALMMPLGATDADHCQVDCTSSTQCTAGEKCSSTIAGSCVLDR